MHCSLSPDAPTPDSSILIDGAFAWTRSPVGDISLLAGPDGLRAIWLECHSFEAQESRGANIPKSEAGKHLSQAISQLETYFQGKLFTFDLTLSPRGTAFQLSVWKALQSIPFGKAISYAQLAAKAGSPKAARAIGSANGRNPIPIIIPCHRVIAADGTIGGFSSGIERKKMMLAMEGVGIKT